MLNLCHIFKGCEGDLVVFEGNSEREFCRRLRAKYWETKMNFGTGAGYRNVSRLYAIVKANEVKFISRIKVVPRIKSCVLKLGLQDFFFFRKMSSF